MGKVVCLLEFWKSIFEFWVEKSNLKEVNKSELTMELQVYCEAYGGYLTVFE